MARRASYSYERMQRDRAKAEKREAKRAARTARKTGDAPPASSDPHDDRPVPEGTVLRFASDATADEDGAAASSEAQPTS